MTGPSSLPPHETLREVVVGRNAKVWQAIAGEPRLARRFGVAISHTELPAFEFRRHDRVWLFAYSSKSEENDALFGHLARARVREVVYISSASTIVNRRSRCYGYPRVKQQAEESARRVLDARVLTLGLVHARVEELPAGANAATSLQQLIDFLLEPHWPAQASTPVQLFSIVRRPFASRTEVGLYRTYGALMACVPRWPCVLRPLDAVLRALGIRWYGYVYLSNLLWLTTTS